MISSSCKCSTRELQTLISRWCPLKRILTRPNTEASFISATLSRSRLVGRWKRQRKSSSSYSLRRRGVTLVMLATSTNQTPVKSNQRSSRTSKTGWGTQCVKACMYRQALSCLSCRQPIKTDPSSSSSCRAFSRSRASGATRPKPVATLRLHNRTHTTSGKVVTWCLRRARGTWALFKSLLITSRTW